MPRQSRIDASKVLRHVIIRGIERTVIFRDDKDRDAFLDSLGGTLLESSTPCYAWSLLGNHAKELRISPSAVSKSIARAQQALWDEDIKEPLLENE